MGIYSMYKVPISAISPNFSLELRDVQDFVAELGPFNGQYAIKFPRNWVQEFQKHIQQLQPVERQAAKTMLDRVSLSLIDTNLTYNASLDWASNIQQNTGKSKFQSIVGDALDPSPFKSWVQALPDIRESKVRTWKFSGKWNDYFAAIEPLLLMSPAAYMVDRYFDPCDQNAENIITSILDKIKGSRCYELHIITRPSRFNRKFHEQNNSVKDHFTTESFKIACRKLDEIFKPRIIKDRPLIFHFVKEDNPGGAFLRMHNRYFLTKYGAIDFGQGFEIQSQSVPQMDAYIVDKEHHKNLCMTYINGVGQHADNLPKRQGIAYPLQVLSHKVSLD
jgi:hypothetical protein